MIFENSEIQIGWEEMSQLGIFWPFLIYKVVYVFWSLETLDSYVLCS